MEEKILYESKTHPKFLVKIVIIQIILLVLHFLLFKFWPIESDGLNKWGPIIAHVIIVLLELYYVVIPVMQWYNNKFIVTNYRIKNEWGVLNKESKEIEIKNIVSAKTERDIIDRIFGCGTLVFYSTSSMDHSHRSRGPRNERHESGVKFYDIPKVIEVEAAINRLRRSIPQ